MVYNNAHHQSVGTDRRPNPDKILDKINRDQRGTPHGKLKIFFGASAGVGKTYTMLNEAKERRAEGKRVVIGVVESHSRSEIVKLIEGFEVIPPTEITYRGIVIKELNLEAAITLKPSLLLIDELAHTNAPGSRHPKRWQDVEELINKGIDVYTTLNVQHLESLNDLVARLTGINVRETVPDQLFDKADDIALVDIPTDELLKRLSEGKVYIGPDADKHAVENFFKKTNLVALRELALRRTAERVDAQMDTLTAEQGQHEAQIGEKILVCVGHDVLTAHVLRHAKRMANRNKAPWYALYVETSQHFRLLDKARVAVDRNLRLAERMGAHIVRLTGNNALEEILNYARSYGFTRIVVGHRHQSPRIRLFQSSLPKQLIDYGAGLEITTVSQDVVVEQPFQSYWRQLVARPSNYVFSFLLMVLSTVVGLLLVDKLSMDNIMMFYLIGVIVIASRFGTGPSIFASVIGVFAYNFFFTFPHTFLNFFEQDDYFLFNIMFITSLIVGSQAARMSHQTRLSRKRESETTMLYALTRDLSSAKTIREMADMVIKHIGVVFDADVGIYTFSDDVLHVFPERFNLGNLKEENVAR
ncbi:MAG: sensor histidine kinase KdpD [Alphaproteobacteria bacterium]|nr:sensor histidine kinase KdpD [Alphaproteobacteria bacterium]